MPEGKTIIPIHAVLIRSQQHIITTTHRSTMDNLIHAMGALNLSSTLGALGNTSRQHAKRIVCTPIKTAFPYMLRLQLLNHLGTLTIMPDGHWRILETLVYHHQILNCHQPRFGWKSMPYVMGLQASPTTYIQALQSKECRMRIHYIDDAKCRSTTATHVIYMARTRVYVEMQQIGRLRYKANISMPNLGITLSRTVHQDSMGISVYKTTTLRALASRTLTDQAMTRTWLCFYSQVIAYLPFDRGPVP